MHQELMLHYLTFPNFLFVLFLSLLLSIRITQYKNDIIHINSFIYKKSNVIGFEIILIRVTSCYINTCILNDCCLFGFDDY
jgi:hypothetical protein